MRPGVGLIAKKLGMTVVFREDGRPVPVTVLAAGPCTVVQAKSVQKDGYRALQLGFELSKKRILREFRMPAVPGGAEAPKEEHAVGSVVTVDIFKAGDRVDVTGTSIGHGFQGGVKRWHWKSGPQTHGSMSHRAPGSIGSSTNPSRVFKGHHLPGHMGNQRVTTQALEVIRTDPAQSLLLVKGAVPGSDNSVVLIRRSRKPPRVAVIHPSAHKKKQPQAQQAARPQPAKGQAAPKEKQKPQGAKG
ncbi:MAG: 50S ribosomal protein L3 [Candidatus Omnitrophica bacterium]|nr:50S ribosomal protein L3 [Candidatus Omnitrophota bacterium]